MIATIAGTRPQFVKSAALSVALQQQGIEEWLIHTGQHSDDEMSGIFFREMGLKEPAYRVPVSDGTPTQRFAAMMQGIEAGINSAAAPIKAMIVFGDSDSSLAGALVAIKKNIPVVHIEAGVRSHNYNMPEEWNRVLVDRAAGLLFCSSQPAINQLRSENNTARLVLSGDIMYDALLKYKPFAEQYQFQDEYTEQLITQQNEFALLTLHRPANVDDAARLQQIVAALGTLPVPVIWSVHPRTAKTLEGCIVPHNIHTIAPTGYLGMLRLLMHATRVITDSGGLQKEAYWMNRPCITLRSETEWTELVGCGWNTLVKDVCPENIADAWKKPAPAAHPVLYGNGDAAQKIAATVKQYLD